LDELIGTETTGAERQRLQQVHELLLRAGPPPELSADLEAGPTLHMTLSKPRRAARPRAMLLLAAALVVALVFFAGYSFSNHRSAGPGPVQVKGEALQGTSLAPQAQGALQVWQPTGGNLPMTLHVVGLPQLGPHENYEVYLVRDGRPWGLCGRFRSSGPRDSLTVPLNAPYSLRPGDSWVVTRPGPGGAEPGQTVLRPTTA
jgi:hypothetical protein